MNHVILNNNSNYHNNLFQHKILEYGLANYFSNTTPLPNSKMEVIKNQTFIMETYTNSNELAISK